MTTIKEFIRVYSPICQPAQDWLRASGLTTMDEAWNVCPRGDWMWWTLRRVASPAKAVSVAFTQWCMERAYNYAATYAAVASYTALAADYAAAFFAAADDAFDDDATYERQAQADWLRQNVANPFNDQKEQPIMTV